MEAWWIMMEADAETQPAAMLNYLVLSFAVLITWTVAAMMFAVAKSQVQSCYHY